MSSFIDKIPVLRVMVRYLERRRVERQWRKQNLHNETKVGSRLFPPQLVQVGKGSYGTIHVQSQYFSPDERLVIGNYVSIAPDVTFFLGVNHQINTATTFPFYSKLVQRSPIDALTNGPIVIEDEVWIGKSAMIFSGVKIGKGAIIAAGSMVTKDVQPYAIVGGNPAKLIRLRFHDDVINILKPICFANFPEEWIRKNIDVIYKKIETVEDALHLKRLADSYNTEKK